MKLTVQVVLHADDDTEMVVREVFTVQREEPLAPDTLGLQLGEANDLLAAVQDTLVEESGTFWGRRATSTRMVYVSGWGVAQPDVNHCALITSI